MCTTVVLVSLLLRALASAVQSSFGLASYASGLRGRSSSDRADRYTIARAGFM
ncbi:hypothetical protein P171DRAFT_430292 [Karstenula rhodostoma CBS 690.94]|uniref:Secreted protein n=1 Tax=Karstenula rhodostoma CBS 690.94 TaxID=1392251 RepID=A0A9P4PNB4_9PLEO|nr:hypothetical protein P171DRAFT_430292 [Karstenula rhodostoma CBS 690.94]